MQSSTRPRTASTPTTCVKTYEVHSPRSKHDISQQPPKVNDATRNMSLGPVSLTAVQSICRLLPAGLAQEKKQLLPSPRPGQEDVSLASRGSTAPVTTPPPPWILEGCLYHVSSNSTLWCALIYVEKLLQGSGSAVGQLLQLQSLRHFLTSK